MDRQSLDRHSLDVLDFPRVRELLAGYCATVPGRELALALEPDTDASRVNLELDRLEEVIAVEEQPALGGVKDIRALLAQARAGSVLTARELLAVRSTGVALRECREFFQRHGARLSAMAGLTGGLGAWPELEAEVGWAIDDSGEIRDAATPELQKIRRELRRRRNDLVGKLEAIIQAGPEWFEGPVAVRGDRFVLPLRQEERSRVAGVVHGASGTGHTLFVEPLQTVAEQNEVQELRDAEAEEQARILRRLTGLVAGSEAGLSAALAAVAAVDLVLAKRRFSGRFGCTRPGISTDGGLELARARHPLLLCRGIDAVPLDFRLPDSTGVVLVSGPNAGGKTVVLKTVGLLSLMAMSGMFVPAGEGTRLPLFERVLADIGDEQSLDRDLSSFTAHLLRLKEFVEQAGSRTLVIIDEIGASTAPEEGAALAMAVLEALRKAGSTCLATTHFGALKLFVQDEPGMTNAAMEFRDGPTYRLLLGTPGESSALDIAERAGLPGWLLARARARLGADWLDLSDKVKALGRELERAERERRQAEAAQQEAGRLRHDYEARLAEFTGWRSAEKTRVSQAGERLLRDARREVENLVRQIREREADHESIVAAKRYVEQKLDELGTGTQEAAAPAPARPAADELPAAGERVRSHRFSRQGTVVAVENGQVVVAFDSIRMTLEPADLERVAGVEVRAPAAAVEEAYRFEPRLDVRGMDRQDAEDAVRRFLDDALVAGVDELSIVHGYGTGALRRMLWERLRRDRRVENLAPAAPAEGGSGVTRVRLRESTA